MVPPGRTFRENPSRFVLRTSTEVMQWDNKQYWPSQGIFLNLAIMGYGNPLFWIRNEDVRIIQDCCKKLRQAGSLTKLCDDIHKRETQAMNEQEDSMKQSYDSIMRAVSTGLPHKQPAPAAMASRSLHPPPPKRQEVDLASASSLDTPQPFSIFEGKTAWLPYRRSVSPPPPWQSPPLPLRLLMPRGSVKLELDEPKIDATPPLLQAESQTHNSIHALKNGEVYPNVSGLRVWRKDDTRIANVFVCLDGPPINQTEKDPFDAMCKGIPTEYSSTMVLSINWDGNFWCSATPWIQNIA
jgi:hypothetical protein